MAFELTGTCCLCGCIHCGKYFDFNSTVAVQVRCAAISMFCGQFSAVKSAFLVHDIHSRVCDTCRTQCVNSRCRVAGSHGRHDPVTRPNQIPRETRLAERRFDGCRPLTCGDLLYRILAELCGPWSLFCMAPCRNILLLDELF